MKISSSCCSHTLNFRPHHLQAFSGTAQWNDSISWCTVNDGGSESTGTLSFLQCRLTCSNLTWFKLLIIKVEDVIYLPREGICSCQKEYTLEQAQCSRWTRTNFTAWLSLALLQVAGKWNVFRVCRFWTSQFRLKERHYCALKCFRG